MKAASRPFLRPFSPNHFPFGWMVIKTHFNDNLYVKRPFSLIVVFSLAVCRADSLPPFIKTPSQHCFLKEALAATPLEMPGEIRGFHEHPGPTWEGLLKRYDASDALDQLMGQLASTGLSPNLLPIARAILGYPE